MLLEYAYFAIVFALLMALCQIIIPWIGIWKNNKNAMNFSKITAFFQSFFVGVTFFIFIYSFYTDDFAFAYIAQNSNSHIPLFYKLAALWGAHSGSLLLWIFVLTLWASAVAFFHRDIPAPILARVLIIMGIITLSFYTYLFLHTTLFARIYPTPADGVNLNPILQDPGLLFHPPLLYLGYVGFSVAFAFAITALWIGKNNALYATWIRPWVQLSWIFLTVGIVLGSWWSYRELGWGGFWFWDPVENASLLPWLCGTALLHVLTVNERKKNLSAWSILLSISVFSLSLLGTFLVRSGVLVSVHTFSEDPSRGLFLLRVFLIITGSALLLYGLRARRFSAEYTTQLLSRESFILMNSILLFVAMLTVLLGTLYPLIITMMHIARISVGPPYFNTVLLPLLILILFFMVFSTLRFFDFSLKSLGMLLAHSGFFIAMIAIIITSTFSDEKQWAMTVGDTAHIAQYTFSLNNLSIVDGENYKAVQADIVIQKNNHRIAEVYPQLRRFYNPNIILPKTGIAIGIFRDFYVALGKRLPNHRWTIYIDIKPMIRWIWGGGALIVFGGIISFLARRYAPY